MFKITIIKKKEKMRENYVTFKDYSISNTGTGTRATVKREIRFYGGGQLAQIYSFPFPFVTVVTVGRGRTEYFQLRNTNNEVVFTTDQEGIDAIFGGGNIAVPVA